MTFLVTVKRREDCVFVAECPAIPGCISQGAIVSGFSRRMLLYYDASRDVFPANDVARATLFKRLSVARAVMAVLGNHHALMKVRLRKDGSIKQVTSLRAILAETWKGTPKGTR